MSEAPPRPGGSAPHPEGKLVHYGRSTFGDPTTEDEQNLMEALPSFRRRHVPAEELVGVLAELDAAATADLMLVQAAGRWRAGDLDPESFHPGDVTALRYFALHPNLRRVNTVIDTIDRPGWAEQDRIDLLWHAQRLASLARTVQHATAYYLPVQSAQAILASTPPDAELTEQIRLPFDVVSVYFGADLEIPPEFQRWSEHLDSGRAETAKLLSRLVAESEDPWMPGTPHLRAEQALARARGFPRPHEAMRDLGGYLSGATLLAAPDGRLADEVIWTVATNLDPALAGTYLGNDRLRGIIDGYLPAATLAPLAYNLAAAACWGAWTAPPPAPPIEGEPGSRAWRKAWKGGAVRRAERRGALAKVRVIDLARTAARAQAAGADPDRTRRASPRPHPRRGHWRRSRVGARSDWHYEGRWIPGRMVSLTGAAPVPGQVVYRLPVPPGTPGAGALDQPDPAPDEVPGLEDYRGRATEAAPPRTQPRTDSVAEVVPPEQLDGRRARQLGDQIVDNLAVVLDATGHGPDLQALLGPAAEQLLGRDDHGPDCEIGG